MTRLPTDSAIDHLLESLRKLSQAPRTGQPRRIDSIETRLRAAVRRDRTGTVAPDGYPAGGSGGNSNGHTNGSTTERAALALVESRFQDRHHDLTALAVAKLDGIVAGLQHLIAALDAIDDLTRTTGPAARHCAHCEGKRGEGNDLPVAHRGTVGDRLERAIDLCKPCYSFVERTAAAGTHTGYLPTDAQIRDHEARGRWRMRVA